MPGKKLRLALAVTAITALAGCEWDNSDKYNKADDTNGAADTPVKVEPNTPTSPSSNIISGVIRDANGAPLKNADTCIDLNENGNCDPDEETVKTNANGQFTLKAPEGITQAPVTVKVVKGQTVNGHNGEPVEHSYANQDTLQTGKTHQFEVDTSQPNTGNLTVLEGMVTTQDGNAYKNAKVCADLNSNGQCDDDEPAGITLSGGRFSLTAPDDGSLPDGADVNLILTMEPGVTEYEGEAPITEPQEQIVTLEVGKDNPSITVEPPLVSINPTPPDTGNDPDATDNPSNPEPVSVTGTVVTGDGYLNGSTVCADLNNNGQCDPDEPSTTSTDEGAFEIPLTDAEADRTFDVVAEVEAGVTINETTGQPESESYTLRTPYTPDQSNLTVSPLTDLVSLELDKMTNPDTDLAVDIVAGYLGTTADVLSDYLADQNSDTPLDAENAERLQRISETVKALKQRIEAEITPEERLNSGLSDQEIDQRIQEQVLGVLPELSDRVTDTLVTDTPFTPDTLLNLPAFTPEAIKPSLRTPSMASLELSERILAARPDTPYFVQDGYERKATPNGETISISLFPHPNVDGKFYYEAVRHRTKSTDLDSATIDSNLTLPRYSRTISLHPFTPENEGSWCSGDSLFAYNCNTIRLDPTPFNALIWGGQVWRPTTLRRGLASERIIVDGYREGSIMSASKDGGLTAIQFYGEFDLDGVDGAAVAETLFSNQLPASAFNSPGLTSAISGNAKAWTYDEEVGAQIIASEWPGHSSGTCPGPGAPDLNAVSSCNLAYGHSPMTYPAQTLEDLTYPAGALGSAYTGSIQNGFASGAIVINGPAGGDYVMRLFGPVSGGEGEIQIDRKLADGSWQVVSTAGRWSYEDSNFPMLRLTLPDAYKFHQASGNFRAGSPMLFERAGFVRYGWVTPEDVDIETLFGRRAIQYVVNDAGLNAIHSALNEMGLLETHPYFWNEYQNLISDDD